MMRCKFRIDRIQGFKIVGAVVSERPNKGLELHNEN